MFLGRDKNAKQIATRAALKKAKAILLEQEGFRGKKVFMDIDAGVLSSEWLQILRIDAQLDGQHCVRWSEAALSHFKIDRKVVGPTIENIVRRKQAEVKWV